MRLRHLLSVLGLALALGALHANADAAGRLRVGMVGKAKFESGAPVKPSDTFANVVLPNREEWLLAIVLYDATDCTTVSSGTWTVTSAPVHGPTRTYIEVMGLTNGDCPGSVFNFNVLAYTWTDANQEQRADPMDATWTAPGYNLPQHFDNRLASLLATAVDLNTGRLDITVDGPPDVRGAAEIEFVGTPANSPVFALPGQYETGSFQRSVPRSQIRQGTYSGLKLRWNVSTPPVESEVRPPAAWAVLGNIRYSQYNTPSESQCTGGTVQRWVVDSLAACNFQLVELVGSFANQVFINGTGASNAHGILKTGAATALRTRCAGRFPPGATVNNSYLQVPDVRGSCNTVLAPDSSLAVERGSVLACRTPAVLVNNGADTNFGNRRSDDLCPACSGDLRGTEGHIDHYTAVLACSGHGVGDLGNYWTVRAR